MDVTQFGARSVENEFLTRYQCNLAFREFANTYFWTLQVGHDRYFASCAMGSFANQPGAVNMVLRLAMAEVQPHHIDASANHLLQQGWIT